MGKGKNKDSFTDIGELYDSPEYGLIIKLTFGKALKRVVGSLIGKQLEVAFKLLKYNRSNAQNRWLWGVAYPTVIAWTLETTGETVSKEAVHAHALQEILGYIVKVEEYQGVEVIFMEGKSTKNLNTKEFNNFKEKLQRYYAVLGCDISDPRGNNYISDFLDE